MPFNTIKDMKRIKGTAVLLLLTAFCASCIFFLLPALKKTEVKSTVIKPTVLTMWHVESFEGGVGSRAEWLKRRALEFEKKYPGVYVDVIKLTPSQLTDRISEGRPFDLVSFGAGVGYGLLGRLLKLPQEEGVFDNLLRSGKVDGDFYALPYSSGGYILACRSSDVVGKEYFSDLKSDFLKLSGSKTVGKNKVELKSVAVGGSLYCCPAFALAMLNGESAQDSAVYFQKDMTQYGAYEKFLQANTATVLAGSQRDYWRLSNRQQNGKIGEIIYATSGNYTDLTQYVGVGASGDGYREELSKSFARYLVCEKSQKTLASVGMLSVADVGLYQTEGIMGVLQSELNGVECPSAFISTHNLQQALADSLTSLKTGDKTLLKKYIVTS